MIRRKDETKIFPQPPSNDSLRSSNPFNGEHYYLMKKGGIVDKDITDKGINININIGGKSQVHSTKLPSLKTSKKKLKLKRQKGYYKAPQEKEQLKKSDFVQLLSKSQEPQLNTIYSGGAFKVSQTPVIFGGIPPKALAPSTYIIPTTIANPIRGTFQPEYKPETEEEKERKRIELEKKKIELEKDREQLEKLKAERLALSLKPEQPEDKREESAPKEEKKEMIEFQPEFTKSLYKEIFRIYDLKSRLKKLGSPIYNKTEVFKDNNYKIIIDNELTPEILSAIRNIIKSSGKTGLKYLSQKVKDELEALPIVFPLSNIEEDEDEEDEED